MVAKEDWAAAMDSEVFRSYLSIEMKKKAREEELKKKEQQYAEKNAVSNFEEFQNKVNASKELKETFKKIKEAFLSNPESKKGVDPSFVNGVMLLNIED